MGGSGIVILGAGQAGAWAARTLRSEGYEGRIVLCGNEGELPYERPPLSKEQLLPQPKPMLHLFSGDDMVSLGIEWHPGGAARRIDRATHTVSLDGGVVIPYEKLIVCTGGRAVLPKVPGFHLPHVFTLRTLADARRLREALLANPRVMVVGGGWIGLEVAASARGLGCAVTVVESGPRLCGRMPIEVVPAFLAEQHARRGVALRLDTTVEGVCEGEGGACRVSLSDGTSHEVEVVVVGVGMCPNDGLARDAGLACDRGIIVDDRCRTSDPSILAAGDVTALSCGDGRMLRLESWQNAQDQGIAAAKSALGQEIRYRPLPHMWSQQYEILLQMAGTFDEAHAAVMRKASDDKFTYIEVDERGVPQAVVCANAPRDFRQIRAYIAAGQSLDRTRMEDPGSPVGKWAMAVT